MTKSIKTTKTKKPTTVKKPTKKLIKSKGDSDGSQINEKEISAPLASALKAVEKIATEAATKKLTVISLLSREQGASIDELMTVTGWQKHSIRGFISNLKKKSELKVNLIGKNYYSE